MKIAVIPDCQVKAGVDLSYLKWIGEYLAEKKPDVIVNIGDFADMPSLSSYDVGKKAFEGRTYKADVDAVIEGMTTLMQPIKDEQQRLKDNHRPRWNPRMVLTLGNHEERILRAINLDRKLDGLIGINDLKYEEFGWEVYPFLEVVEIEGVAFSHYFTTGTMGRPVTSASSLLTKKHQSAVMGHVQHRQIAYAHKANGKQLTGLFVGSCYLHDEDYLGNQGNNYWRGIWMLHEVQDGSFDEMPVSLYYLGRNYA